MQTKALGNLDMHQLLVSELIILEVVMARASQSSRYYEDNP